MTKSPEKISPPLAQVSIFWGRLTILDLGSFLEGHPIFWGLSSPLAAVIFGAGHFLVGHLATHANHGMSLMVRASRLLQIGGRLSFAPGSVCNEYLLNLPPTYPPTSGPYTPS